jgi:pectinesterase
MFRRSLLLGLLAWLPLGALTPEPADARVDAADPKAFRDIQSAVNAAPRERRSEKRWVIDVAPGRYAERVRIPREAGPMLLRGAGLERTKVVVDRNANDLDAAGQPVGTFESSVFRVDADACEVQGLTIENSSQKVGQAVAVRLDGDRLIFRQCALLGRQDTLLVNKGRHYFDRCTIAGTVDFIFGAATAYFDRCDIRVLGKGYVAAPATPREQPYGLVFVDCGVGLEAEPGMQTYLARPWREHGAALYLRCRLGACIRKEGWDNWRNPEREKTARFQEAESSGPGANAAARVQWAKPVGAAATVTPAKVLGGVDDWRPERR